MKKKAYTTFINENSKLVQTKFRSSPPEVFSGKDVPKICSKFTGKDPYRSVILIKLQSNLTEITLKHGCSSANLLHISEHLFIRTPQEVCF